MISSASFPLVNNKRACSQNDSRIRNDRNGVWIDASVRTGNDDDSRTLVPQGHVQPLLPAST